MLLEFAAKWNWAFDYILFFQAANFNLNEFNFNFNLIYIYFCSEVAWALESNSVLSMINEPDVAGKTPVDYASEGKTPRCCTVERKGV